MSHIETQCALCHDPLVAISVIRTAGDVEHPEPLVLCQRCGFLPTEERTRLRGEAMREQLTAELPPWIKPKD